MKEQNTMTKNSHHHSLSQIAFLLLDARFQLPSSAPMTDFISTHGPLPMLAAEDHAYIQSNFYTPKSSASVVPERQRNTDPKSAQGLCQALVKSASAVRPLSVFHLLSLLPPVQKSVSATFCTVHNQFFRLKNRTIPTATATMMISANG